MKKLYSLVVTVAVLGVAIWWFTRQADKQTAPAKVVQTVLTSKQNTSNTIIAPSISPPKPVQVAASSAVPSQTESANTVQPNSPVVVPAELKATISNVIVLLEAGDWAGFNKEFVMSPSWLAKQKQSVIDQFNKTNQERAQQGQPAIPEQDLTDQLNRIEDDLQHPPMTAQMQSRIPAALVKAKAIENAIPTFNEAGDVAVYTLETSVPSTLPENQQTVTVHKENGRWYDGSKP